jgi:hypothetical protein
MMLIEGHTVEAQLLAQDLFVEVLVVKLVTFGRIEKVIRSSKEALFDDAIIGSVTVWPLGEVS